VKADNMMARRHLKALFACVCTAVLAVVALMLVQHVSETPEPHLLSHDVPPADPRPGKIVLSLSSAMVTFAAGPPGAPLRVESKFDPDIFTLAHRYEDGGDGGWTWRLDFHEKSVLNISVIKIWLGRRSPEVTVRVPPGLPFDLEATMEGGYLVTDFADLNISTADVELDRGVLQIMVSNPMDDPMKRLSVRGTTGTVFLDRLGNASPERLNVRHRLGAARIDLHGQWRSDADIDFQVAYGNGELNLPDNVRIDGLGPPLEFSSEQEIPLPTLRVGTHSNVGRIRITY